MILGNMFPDKYIKRMPLFMYKYIKGTETGRFNCTEENKSATPKGESN